MLRVRLSAEDLSRLRFAVSPVNQAVTHAAQLSRSRRNRASALEDLSGVGTSGSAVGLVLQLLSVRPGDRPDFLTPPPPESEQGLDLDTELDAIRTTPASTIVEDLRGYRIPPRMRDLLGLADGNERLRNRMVDGLRQLHHAEFGRDWDTTKAWLRADIARRTTELGYHGISHVLSRLHPRVSYKPGVLTVHSHRNDPDVEGAGNGLVLVPTVVPSKSITIKTNPRDPFVLVYPVSMREPPRPTTVSTMLPDRALGNIIGHSRAAIMLALLATPNLSTSELAQRCGVAISSASEHATALRKAGLLTSYRERNKVLHTLTTSGAQLARGEATD